MIPKIFINFIETLPDKEESEDCGGTFITSDGFVPTFLLRHHLYPYDIVTLPKETRTILYKYDCDCVPFFEKQMGVVRTCNDLADLWGLTHSPESPPTPGCVSSVSSVILVQIWLRRAHRLCFPPLQRRNLHGILAHYQLQVSCCRICLRPTSEHRLARRQQQLFWKTCMKQRQKMKTDEQRQHLITPRRQKSLSRQEKEGALDPVKNSLIKKCERKL